QANAICPGAPEPKDACGSTPGRRFENVVPASMLLTIVSESSDRLIPGVSETRSFGHSARAAPARSATLRSIPSRSKNETFMDGPVLWQSGWDQKPSSDLPTMAKCQALPHRELSRRVSAIRSLGWTRSHRSGHLAEVTRRMSGAGALNLHTKCET